jgi:hypothetical protein
VLAVQEELGLFYNTLIADRMMSKVQPHEQDGPSKANGLCGMNKVSKTKKNPGCFTDSSREFWKHYHDNGRITKIAVDLLQIPFDCEQGKA